MAGVFYHRSGAGRPAVRVGSGRYDPGRRPAAEQGWSRTRPPRTDPADPPVDDPRHLLRLADKGFVVVTGKGGVGKSAVAATLGSLFADAGRRTLVVEVDPRENLHQLLGTPPSGGDVLEAGDALHVQHLKPRAVVDRVIAERVKVGALVRRLQSSSVYQHFVEGAPGLKELAVLEHARRLLDEGRFETVVLDAPATGHGVSLLRAPGVVAEAVGEGPFGRIAAEIGDLVADPERCAVVVVTQAEEMPVDEALDLRGILDEHLGRRPDLLVVNALYPPVPDSGADAEGDDPLLDLWHRRRAVNRRELERLIAAWPEPRVGLPLLPERRGPELVAGLVACLRRDPFAPLGRAAPARGER